MAEKSGITKSDREPDRRAAEKAREEGTEVPISAAADGVVSRYHKRYADNPDKPDESSVAQVQELHPEAYAEPGGGEG